MKEYSVDFEISCQLQASSEADATVAAIRLAEKLELPEFGFRVMSMVVSRTYRFCGCTDEHACEGGCAWVTQEEDVCDSEACLAKLAAERLAVVA